MTVTNEAEARQLVSKVLPETDTRGKCLRMFREAIVEANVYGRDKWAVTCAADRIRLHAGHIIVCTLENKRIWMALDKQLLTTSSRPPTQKILQQSSCWQWDKDQYPEYSSIASRNGYYLPLEDHTELWPKIRRLHFESIYRAANSTTMDPRTPSGHSPGVLKYLRNELGLHVPDPLY